MLQRGDIDDGLLVPVEHTRGDSEIAVREAKSQLCMKQARSDLPGTPPRHGFVIVKPVTSASVLWAKRIP